MIQIFEGPKVKIGSINFVGCEFATGAQLKTHISSRQPILGLFGKYHRDMLEDDRQKLIDYYQKQGFFEAKVTPVTRAGKDLGEIELTFVIHEGIRYTVRNVIIEGNSKLKTGVLKEDLELHSGKPFLQAVRDADKNRILIKYREIGCIDTQVVEEPRFTNQSGVVDLLYKIEEGEPYLLGELEIQGNGRTKDKVIRREAVQAGLLPGEVLDMNRIDIYKKRLGALEYFQNNPQGQNGGKQIDVKIVNRRPKDKPYGELMMPLIGEVSQARMQDPGPGSDPAPSRCRCRARCPRSSRPPRPTRSRRSEAGSSTIGRTTRSTRSRTRCRRSTSRRRPTRSRPAASAASPRGMRPRRGPSATESRRPASPASPARA